MVDPVPVGGTLSMRQEYTLNGMPGHQRAPTHTFTHSFIPRDKLETKGTGENMHMLSP